MALVASRQSCYKPLMKRLLACLRETWWLWLVFFAGCTAMVVYLGRVFVVTYPICIFTFVYFAVMRFDENGDKLS